MPARKPKADADAQTEVQAVAAEPLATELRERDSCRCGAQFLNGAWWTRMGGLGHTHESVRALRAQATEAAQPVTPDAPKPATKPRVRKPSPAAED